MSENIKYIRKQKKATRKLYYNFRMHRHGICAGRITGSYAAGDCHCRSKKL